MASVYESPEFAPKPMAIPIPTEFEEQCKVVQYLEILQRQGKDIIFTATAQNTYTKSWRQKHKNTAQGVRKGLPDLVIIINKELVFIEMKRLKKGIVEPEQVVWNQKLKEAGQNAFICKGFEEAKTIIDKFI